MKNLMLILLITILLACGYKNHHVKMSESPSLDTLYMSSCYGTRSFKQAILRFGDTTDLGKISFFIGEPQSFKVQIDRFEKYPILIDSSSNVTIILADSVNGIFSVIPRDSVFYIGLVQNFGNGNVIAKYNCSGESFRTINLDGIQECGSLILNATSR